MNILIALFGFVLIVLCLFTLLVVMVQKPKGDGGMGAALGGGSMEAAFGAETGSLLTKITIYSVIGFFVLTFALYLGNIASKQGAEADAGESLLSEVIDESASTEAGGVTSDSALQQAIQIAEEAAQNEAATSDETGSINLEDSAGEAVDAAAEAVDAVEETVNPEN